MIDDGVPFRGRTVESVRLFGLAVRMVWRVGPLLLALADRRIPI
ncbi:hypothetical protein SAMN04489812_3737 [Microlunatus soli]|uniref:Uncharacterized protein n=1 Tax=Microlunatus soli TaxID=630515 RepID=A0A1H1WPV9_9ACTN|nr:hypothetical protein SAMN04489812_3737 [Microlunatus soli]